jgi:hypothetical protein
MRTSSFADILIDQIIKEFIGETQDSPRESLPERDLSPANLAFLMGKISKTQIKKTFQSSPYKTYYKAPPPPRPEKLQTQNVRILNPKQREALKVFLNNGFTLGEEFTVQELKQAFRKTALKVHPDMNGGSSAPFIELKNAFESLSLIFRNSQNAPH